MGSNLATELAEALRTCTEPVRFCPKLLVIKAEMVSF